MKMFYGQSIMSEPNPSHLCLNLSESAHDHQNSVLSHHFCNLWLRDMGYGSRQTEKMIVRMAKTYLGDQQISHFMHLYKHMD